MRYFKNQGLTRGAKRKGIFSEFAIFKMWQFLRYSSGDRTIKKHRLDIFMHASPLLSINKLQVESPSNNNDWYTAKENFMVLLT